MDQLPMKILSNIIGYALSDIETFKNFRFTNTKINKLISNEHKLDIDKFVIKIEDDEMLDRYLIGNIKKFIDFHISYENISIFLPLYLVSDNYILESFENCYGDQSNFYLYTDSVIYRLVKNSDDILTYYNYDNVCCKPKIELPNLEDYTFICNKCLDIHNGEEGYYKKENDLMFCGSCNMIRVMISMYDFKKHPRERVYCCRKCSSHKIDDESFDY